MLLFNAGFAIAGTIAAVVVIFAAVCAECAAITQPIQINSTDKRQPHHCDE